MIGDYFMAFKTLYSVHILLYRKVHFVIIILLKDF